MEYQISVAEDHIDVITRALDLFSRIGTAQFEEVLKHPQWDDKRFIFPKNNYIHDYNTCKELLRIIKRFLTGLPTNASYGISTPEVDERSKIAFDLLQVIRHRLAWDKHPKGGTQVDFDKPLQLAGHKLAEIKKLEKNSNV